MRIEGWEMMVGGLGAKGCEVMGWEGMGDYGVR